MDSFETKKLALLRILQILREHSDCDHPLTQKDISAYLEKEYGIKIERKAVGRNLSLLKESGIEIASSRQGAFLEEREFEDSELRMLIDGILSSKYISAVHSQSLIERLCGLSSQYFRSHIKNIYSVNDWGKTDNQALFYNIELIDEAIEQKKQLHYNYNKYGVDKKLHKSSHQYVSPYQMILHNQRYYLMGYSEYWKNMIYHRLDHITNMTVTELPATDLRSLPGYQNGIDYKELASSKPYMFADKAERITLLADSSIIDQVMDWFGNDVRIMKHGEDDSKVQVILNSSPNAMKLWALQYIQYVEILKPESLRSAIRECLEEAGKKYE
jgi:predicted DNA-binding transcriptional regulator YafY